MAAKKATTRKYRQAKQAAKPAAKAAFPGKKQAAKRDPKLKISAEDRIVAKEVSESAKTDLGKNAYLKKSDYEATQKTAREKFRSSMRDEFGEYGGKKATPAEAEAPKKPTTKKSTVSAKGKSFVENGKVVSKARAEEIMSDTKKPAAKKPTSKKATAPKPQAPAKTADAPKMTKSAANKAAWAKMTPEERRNWKSNKPGAKPSTYEAARAAGKTPAEAAKAANPNLFKEKPAAKAASKPEAKAPKRVTLADLKRNEAKGLEEAKARVAAKNKALANSAKGKTQTPQAEKARATAKPEGKAVKVAKKSSRTFRVAKFAAKKFPLAMVAGEVVSAGKGSTFKDLKEINRLKAKLGDKPMSAKEGAVTQASNLANLATMGLVGKTRRQRMDELNKKITKAENQNKKLRYGKGGESLVPGTAAYKAGSKTRPAAGAASKPSVGGGGSTTKYTVKKGDTLSGIAKNAGLTVSEVRAINPKLMNDPKYKKGSMIWSGTKVNIKKK